MRDKGLTVKTGGMIREDALIDSYIVLVLRLLFDIHGT